MAELLIASNENDYAVASVLFREYADWLGIDLCFQKFDEELLQLPQMYGPPGGTIILAKHENEYTGCIAFRKIDSATAELKRMYVKPFYRKLGIGKMLLQEALMLSRKAGYHKIRLDTLSNMTTAINLYKQNGFYEIPPYYHNPENTAVFFERTFGDGEHN